MQRTAVILLKRNIQLFEVTEKYNVCCFQLFIYSIPREGHCLKYSITTREKEYSMKCKQYSVILIVFCDFDFIMFKKQHLERLKQTKHFLMDCIEWQFMK